MQKDRILWGVFPFNKITELLNAVNEWNIDFTLVLFPEEYGEPRGYVGLLSGFERANSFLILNKVYPKQENFVIINVRNDS